MRSLYMFNWFRDNCYALRRRWPLCRPYLSPTASSPVDGEGELKSSIEEPRIWLLGDLIVTPLRTLSQLARTSLGATARSQYI